MCASLGMFPHFSMYAALQPVPKMQPILQSVSVYAEAMRVPMVSLTRAATLIGKFYLVSVTISKLGDAISYSFFQCSLKRLDDIFAFDTLNVKALGPSL